MNLYTHEQGAKFVGMTAEQFAAALEEEVRLCGPFDIVNERVISNIKVRQRIAIQEEAARAAADRQIARMNRIFHEEHILWEVVKAAIPKILQELERRLKEPPMPETKKGEEDLVLAEVQRRVRR